MVRTFAFLLMVGLCRGEKVASAFRKRSMWVIRIINTTPALKNVFPKTVIHGKVGFVVYFRKFPNEIANIQF